MPAAVLLTVFFLFAASARADDLHLIRVGDFWRYFKGVNEPGSPLGAWRLPEFDDRNWPLGLSGFSTLTYTSANTPEATALQDFGLGYNTVYFRKDFIVAQPASLAALLLRIDYDDGFIAYLNGREVARRGIAGTADEPLAAGSLAANHPRGPTEEIDVSHALPLLRTGTNLLAIQVLGSSPADYSFAFIAELAGNFTRGPYLQNTTSNSTQIIWKTLTPALAFIDLRTNRLAASNRIAIDAGETNHVATLTGLLPDTAYEYRAGALLNGREALADWHPFRTFKPSGPITFAVIGDSGWGGPAQYNIAAQMRQAAPELIMHLGDLIYYAFTRYAADFRCLSVYADQLSSTPMYVSLGNHEMYIDRAAALETFYLPTNNLSGAENFYSFDHGEVHFSV
ncbi:MAG TPA: metallophosphoesterase family protein, partial [Verrucomicrobiae bacterium]|nr:metallophosphoesterase family protein [Verrucomicrobiae bacterium]